LVLVADRIEFGLYVALAATVMATALYGARALRHPSDSGPDPIGARWTGW
jgi:hypothetical protein